MLQVAAKRNCDGFVGVPNVLCALNNSFGNTRVMYVNGFYAFFASDEAILMFCTQEPSVAREKSYLICKYKLSRFCSSVVVIPVCHPSSFYW